MGNHQLSRLLEERIQMGHIHIAHIATLSVRIHILGQEEGRRIALLLGNEIGDVGHLGGVNKGALHTHRVTALREEHVTTTNQLVSTRTVQNGTRVNHLHHTKGDTGGEVSLDGTGNDVGRRSLRGDNHVNTYRTSQLGDTSNRQLHILSRCHNQVSKLINHHHNIGHVLVPLFGIQFAGNKLLVILLDVAHMGRLQQVVAGIHLHADGVKRLHHLGHVGNHRLPLVGQLG